jgi:chemotaxis regulatin CheY-phosphate phosphatase CheZ
LQQVTFKKEIVLSHTHTIPAEKIERLSGLIHGLAESTQESTDSILHLCETMTNETMAESISSIYKACAVQDLTNQRIKIIQTLIEEISTGIYGTEDSLLEGPQRTQNALSQDDIDNLLNGSQ